MIMLRRVDNVEFATQVEKKVECYTVERAESASQVEKS